MNWKPQLITYADDFIILHRDKAVIHQGQQRVTEWLQKLGLELHPTKTRIAHTLDPQGGKAGFEFLGSEIRQYPVSRHQAKGGCKPLLNPSREALKRHSAPLCEIMRNNRAARQEHLIGQLNPVTAGWSRYDRAAVSKAGFQGLDNARYLRLARWARLRHPHQGRRWIAHQGWRIEEGKGWCLGTKEGAVLNHHSAEPVGRYGKVRETASPFNGDWPYGATRRGTYPGLPRRVAFLLRPQQGRWGYCGLVF